MGAHETLHTTPIDGIHGAIQVRRIGDDLSAAVLGDLHPRTLDIRETVEVAFG